MEQLNPSPDVGLMLLHRVAGLEHLHFGYWNPGDALTYENCVAAQQRYTERLLGLIPAGARSILDVGCGVGATSRQLHQRGYAVQSVTPDPSQVRAFRDGMPPAVRLHACRFQDLVEPVRADLILFSESAQYIPLDDWVRGCRRHLDREGTRSVVVADWFLQLGQSYYGTPHDEATFLRCVADEGFVLHVDEDVTEETAPTLAYLSKLHADHLLPAFAFAAEVCEMKAPFWWRVATRVAGRRMERFKHFMRNDVSDRLDPDGFKQRVRYRIYRFEVARDAIVS